MWQRCGWAWAYTSASVLPQAEDAPVSAAAVEERLLADPQRQAVQRAPLAALEALAVEEDAGAVVGAGRPATAVGTLEGPAGAPGLVTQLPLVGGQALGVLADAGDAASLASRIDWVLEDEVLEYLDANYDAVQADMDSCSTTLQPKEGDRRKRHELSRSATKAICLSAFTLSVKFD